MKILKIITLTMVVLAATLTQAYSQIKQDTISLNDRVLHLENINVETGKHLIEFNRKYSSGISLVAVGGGVSVLATYIILDDNLILGSAVGGIGGLLTLIGTAQMISAHREIKIAGETLKISYSPGGLIAKYKF